MKNKNDISGDFATENLIGSILQIYNI